jgi:TonB-dependent SusC/RagA subfamily outer membrane receptor
MNSVTPDKIKSVNVLKDETAVKKYGEEGKNGVIEISTKDAVPKKQ